MLPPALSVVRQPAEKLGREAARPRFERLKGRGGKVACSGSADEFDHSPVLRMPRGELALLFRCVDLGACRDRVRGGLDGRMTMNSEHSFSRKRNS